MYPFLKENHCRYSKSEKNHTVNDTQQMNNIQEKERMILFRLKKVSLSGAIYKSKSHTECRLTGPLCQDWLYFIRLQTLQQKRGRRKENGPYVDTTYLHIVGAIVEYLFFGMYSSLLPRHVVSRVDLP